MAIAVLPFQNLSTSAEGEVLASGIAESVLHQLASLAELDVISRTSSFAFRDRAADAREIGRQLGARYLLEGSVQSDRTRMRVTTQLIDTETGADVWSMRFDRLPGDIFAIQDEIAMQVTQALELTLDPREGAHDRSGHDEPAGLSRLSAGPEPARQQRHRSQGGDRALRARDQARSEVSRCVRQPGAGGALRRRVRGHRRPAGPLRGGAGAREDAVEKALVARPGEWRRAICSVRILPHTTNLAAAEADYRRGLELSPNSAEGYAGLAAVLYQTPSRRDEALEMLDRARKLDFLN